MNAMNTTIQRAIDQSIRQNEIVTLKGYTVDTAEWVDVVNGLADRAEDWVETNGSTSEPGNSVREYWGTDEDGDEWRVHVAYRTEA